MKSWVCFRSLKKRNAILLVCHPEITEPSEVFLCNYPVLLLIVDFFRLSSAPMAQSFLEQQSCQLQLFRLGTTSGCFVSLGCLSSAQSEFLVCQRILSFTGSSRCCSAVCRAAGFLQNSRKFFQNRTSIREDSKFIICRKQY